MKNQQINAGFTFAECTRRTAIAQNNNQPAFTMAEVLITPGILTFVFY